MNLRKNSVNKRQRRPAKKRTEQSQQLDEARNRFLNAQNVTPEVFAAHDAYMKGLQKHFDSLGPRFALREFCKVIILKGNSPKELFLMKASEMKLAQKFHKQLTEEYTGKNNQLVYCLREGMICVARSTQGWHRCRILKLHPNETCDAFLFDIGMIERINWNDLRIIDGIFQPKVLGCSIIDFPPLAIPCALIHTATEQRIERFTLQSNDEFLYHLETQQDFYAFANRVDGANGDGVDVFLYYKDGHEFHCVNNVFPMESYSDVSSSEESIRPMQETTTATMLSIATNRSTRSPMVSEVNAVPDTPELRESPELLRTPELPMTPEMLETPESLVSPESRETSHSVDNKPNSTNEEIVKPDEFCLISKPETVIVRNVVSIDEIYIFYTRYQQTFTKFCFDIQAYAEEQNFNEKIMPIDKFWRENDSCLVMNPYSRSGEWVRGKIAAFSSYNECLVYLRDYGKTIPCRNRNLRSISKKLSKVQDFTWKVRLSSIRLSNGHSNEMINEQLNDLMKNEMAISVIEKSSNGCGVILWTVNRVCSALFADQITYENINEKLVESGLVMANVSFDGINKFMNPEVTVDVKAIQDEFIQGMNCSTIYDANGNQVHNIEKYRTITDNQTEMKYWLPTEQIKAKKFVAFPEHVSKNLIIHVLEASRKTAAEEIERILQAKNRDKKLEQRNPLEWKQNDACFARFYYDKFYRATIRRVNFAKKTCVVRFIDYGNCELLLLDDLRKATMFGDIPALSHPYQLYNIRPISPDGIWTEAAQSFCLKLIIEKHCELQVVEERSSNNGDMTIDLCRLESLSKYKDVASALVAQGHARFIEDPSEEPISI